MSQGKRIRIVKLRIVATYLILTTVLTTGTLTWWVVLLCRWWAGNANPWAVGLVPLGIALNAALATWLTDWVLGWAGDDDDDDWHDPEPIVLPPLEKLGQGGR